MAERKELAERMRHENELKSLEAAKFNLEKETLESKRAELEKLLEAYKNKETDYEVTV